MLETIKEYLISLGFKVDNSSLNKAQQAMKTVESSVTSFSNESVKNFAKATTGVLTFVATANLALGKFVASLAHSDLETQMFAQRMWMSVDAARAYQNSIKALGVNVNDLYLSPELMQRYQELNKLSREMSVPTKDYEQSMKGVRDITFEFQKLKLEGTYALQWIGYYLTRYLAGPMGDLKKWLASANDTIQQKMPVWTARVAEVASWFVRLGKAAWSIRDAIGAVIGAITAFKLINLATSPIGALILGMTALLLLVDDYNAFENDKSGKSSYFNDLWKWVDRFKKSLEDNGTIGKFKNDLLGVINDIKELKTWFEKVSESPTFKKFISDTSGLLTTLWHGVENTWNWLESLYVKLRDNGDLDSFSKTAGDAWGSVTDLVGAIGDLLNALGGKGGLGEALQSGVIAGLEAFRDILESIAGTVTIIAGGIKGIATGDFSGMEKGFKMFMNGVPKGLMKESPELAELRKKMEESDKKNGLKPPPAPADPNQDPSSPGFFALPGMNGEEVRPTAYEPTAYKPTTYNKPSEQWSSFKNSIPGANADVSNVDWSSLRKGFVAFMNSIPKEFGDITKGLFQTAKGYGNLGGLAGAGVANYTSYLYPQTNTSNMSQITLKQNNYIYGAKDTQGIASAVGGVTTSSLTRHFQGSVR